MRRQPTDARGSEYDSYATSLILEIDELQLKGTLASSVHQLILCQRNHAHYQRGCVRARIWVHFHNRIGVLYVTSDIRVMTPAQSTGYASDTRGVQPVKSSVTLPFHSLVAFVPV